MRALLGAVRLPCLRPLPSSAPATPWWDALRLFHTSAPVLAKKKQRVVSVRLVSSAGTGFSYYTRRRATLSKLQLRKYDPVLRRHVWFTEEKISRKRIVQRRR